MRIQLKLSRTRHILIIQASQQGNVLVDIITFDKRKKTSTALPMIYKINSLKSKSVASKILSNKKKT